MHLPEAALEAGGLGGAGGGPGPGVAGADREVPEDDRYREALQPRVERRAERALEVGVDDDERSARTADVVVVRGGWDGS